MRLKLLLPLTLVLALFLHLPMPDGCPCRPGNQPICPKCLTAISDDHATPPPVPDPVTRSVDFPAILTPVERNVTAHLWSCRPSRWHRAILGDTGDPA